jgi:hypothetical protein
MLLVVYGMASMSSYVRFDVDDQAGLGRRRTRPYSGERDQDWTETRRQAAARPGVIEEFRRPGLHSGYRS